MPRRRSRKVRRVFFRQTTTADDQLPIADMMNRLALSPVSEPVYEFKDMQLREDLLKGILNHGYETPAFCQQNVILPMIQGRDIICQAQSGMGKTAAFCISILQRLGLSNLTAKALVLAPTRELAEQIHAEFGAFAKFMPIRIVLCIGGVGKLWWNLEKVKTGNFHIAVGTLGRIAHLLRFKNGKGLNGNSIKMFVIDEADKFVMDRSFQTDLKLVINKIAGDAQVIVTSATMPRPAQDRFHEFMQHPFTFLLRNNELTLDGIQQFHLQVGSEIGKLETIHELFPIIQSYRGIIFCNTRKRAEDVTRKMQERGHRIDGMTGTMDQDARKSTLADFKLGRVPVLIASDLLGRGVDIHHVQLVINFDMPMTKEEYLHRVGRAGRYGKKGVAITFVTDLELQTGRLKGFASFYETEIPQLTPNVRNIMNRLR